MPPRGNLCDYFWGSVDEEVLCGFDADGAHSARMLGRQWADLEIAVEWSAELLTSRLFSTLAGNSGFSLSSDSGSL